MTDQTATLLSKSDLTHSDLITLLNAQGDLRKNLFARAAEIKNKCIGNKVYFRGLIEYSNICSKNCYYCGVRRENHKVERYQLTDEEVLEAAQFALDNHFASIVIQSGERSDHKFIDTIERLLCKIKKLSDSRLGITLSMGEQTEETYNRWFEAGAHRYLLRIETSDRELYSKLHPNDSIHDFDARIESLRALRRAGYQVGSGVMIGLPFQTIESLAHDLLFLKEIDIDMAGMGPFIEHKETPLYKYTGQLLPRQERFELSLKMVALLRILMKNINIAATTAMQTIDPQGREKSIMVGSNVIMPNLTPVKYRENYKLYEDKPCIDEEAEQCRSCLEARIHIAGNEIGWDEWGDSKHFALRMPDPDKVQLVDPKSINKVK
ncbi:MAG TPA: [FeFe] hydrogenase H-cluster radical SAM maturase HydE [Bacteroidales bacterium]|nr:MAG: [FeFe] hydrogenase H-cluster radical SAM maturase HydE [Bacteroidetes bacterium GWE2_42_24]OFY26891.1 MAG: [FeFe] hydrogenase H-cluster radical SAM maturase HydE [Bacteroidetes bacterium GWF2_43_11]HBZ67813.1 [FeFe] hydrogenase H-cluster radical SAM maturase HydE [Bacteroidales bacterium]